MLSPVSTGMGDRVRFDSGRRHFISVCNQPLLQAEVQHTSGPQH